jgi:membrane protein implicated in regulation of membrane protease activity
MDETARGDLRIRFIKLIVLLNAILILIAVAVLLYFKVPPPWGTAGVVVLLAAAVGLFLFFLRMYRQTKQWLEDEHRKRVQDSSGDTGTSTEETSGSAG